MSKEQKYPQLFAMWMAIFSDIIGFTLLITVYPALLEEFNLDPLKVGGILAINGLFSFISAPIWGRLSDKYGRKPMLLVSQFGTFLGFMILAFSNNIEMVIYSRIIDGIFGGNFPIGKAVINDIVEPQDMAKEMTNIGLFHNLANIIGPALGGILFEQYGLMGPGLLAAGTSVFTFIITLRNLEETAPNKIEINKDKISNIEKYSSNHPTNNHQIKKWYKNSSLKRALVIFGLSSIGFMTLVSNFAMFSSIHLNIGAKQMGIFLAIAGIFQLIIRFTLYVPSLKKFGEIKLVKYGFIIYLFAYGFIGLVGNAIQLLLILLLMSFATSATRGGLSAFISNLAEPEERGKVQGISSSLDTFAQIAGPLVGGALLTYFSASYFGIFSWIFMFTALLVLGLSKEMKKELQNKKKKFLKDKGILKT